MGKSSLEDKIHNRLKDHSVDIDNDALWASIGLDYKKKKNKRGAWIWILNGVLVLLVISSAWYMTSANDEVVGSNNLNSQVESEKLNLTSSSQDQAELQANIQQESSNLESNQTIFSSTSSNQTIQSQTNSNKINQSQTTINVKESKVSVLAKIVNEGYSKKAAFTASTVSSIGTDQTTLKNIIVNDRIYLQTDDFINKGVLDSNSIVNQNLDHSTNQSSNQPLSQPLNKRSPSSDMTSRESERNQSRGLFNFQFLEAHDMNVLSTKIENYDLFVMTKIKPFNDKNKLSGNKLSFYTGVSQVNKSLTLIDIDKAADLTRRLASEKQLEQFNLGADIKIPIYNGLYAKAGLRYDVISDRSTFTDNDTIKTVFSTLTEINYDFEGNRTEIFSDAEGSTVSSVKLTFYNQLYWLSIPLTLGYEKNIGNVSFFGEGSVLFNIHQSYSGDLENPITGGDQSPIFKERSPLSLNLAAGVEYRLSPRISTSLEANYFLTPSSITKSEYGIEQRYRSYGLSLGVNYDL